MWWRKKEIKIELTTPGEDGKRYFKGIEVPNEEYVKNFLHLETGNTYMLLEGEDIEVTKIFKEQTPLFKAIFPERKSEILVRYKVKYKGKELPGDFELTGRILEYNGEIVTKEILEELLKKS